MVGEPRIVKRTEQPYLGIRLQTPFRGMFTATPLPGDGLVKPGLLPAGHYASLIYIGLGLAANKALQEWIRANNLQLDKWTDPKGDAFSCRYEAYLTDPKVEPRKKQWEIELAMKLADKQT